MNKYLHDTKGKVKTNIYSHSTATPILYRDIYVITYTLCVYSNYF